MEGGKKIYTFKRATPQATPQVVAGPRVSTPKLKRVSPLKRLLEKVRKRRKIPTVNVYKVNRVPLKFSHFNRFRIETKKSINISVPESKNEMMSIQKDTLPTQQWMDAQAKFIRELNVDDFYTVMAYTVRSHQWIGPYMRTGKLTQVKFTKPSGFIVPLYTQVSKIAKSKTNPTDFERETLLSPSYYVKNINKIPMDVLKDALDMYINDLQRIMKKAPPLPKTMVVYRGIQDDIFKKKVGVVHKIDAFASTAYVPQSVYGPRNYLRIKLLKGSRVLLLQCLNDWNFEGEFEVLLNYGSKYVIHKRNLMRPVINTMYGYPVMKHVTDVTVL